MPIFGAKDALSPRHLAELSEVAGVRGFGGEFDAAYFVRAVKGNPQGELVKLAQRRLLEAARVQQQLIDSGARHWAPIHLSGTGAKGPYVVTAYYPRTAEQFIRTKTTLARKSLYRIVNGVVAGLREIKELRGRPHGNLKPSNVLLTGEADDRKTLVVLVDPAPAEDLAKQTQGTNDLYELGQLIHQLVLHRPFTGTWPIPAGPEWSRLGGGGGSWRGLCNQLLHPNPEKRPTRLKQVAKSVAALKPGRLSLRSPLAVAAMLIAAVGAGAWVVTRESGGWWKRQTVATDTTVKPMPSGTAREERPERVDRAVVLSDVRPAPTEEMANGNGAANRNGSELRTAVEPSPTPARTVEPTPVEPSPVKPTPVMNATTAPAQVQEQRPVVAVANPPEAQTVGTTQPTVVASAVTPEAPGNSAATPGKVEMANVAAEPRSQVDEAAAQREAQARADQERADRERADRERMDRERAEAEAVARRRAEAEAREREVAQARAREMEQEQERLRKEAERVAVALLGTKVSDDPVIQKEWSERVGPLVHEIRADASKNTPDMAAGVEHLRALLVSADAAAREMPKPQVDAPDAPWGAGVAEAIKAVGEKRRQRVVEQLVGATRPVNGRVVTTEEAKHKWREVRAGEERWIESARAYVQSIAQAEQLLRAGYDVDEKPAADQKSPAEVLASLKDHELARDARVVAAIRPLVESVEVSRSQNWQDLLRLAASEQNQLGLRLTAWGRLGGMKELPWPSEQGDLQQSLSIAENLNAAAERVVTEPSRRGRIRESLEQQGRVQWAQFLDRATTVQAVQFALGLKQSVLGDREVPLSPRARFNVALHDARLAMNEGGDAGQAQTLAAAADKLLVAAQALPAQELQRADTAGLVATLREWRQNSGGLSTDFAKTGPMTPGTLSASAFRWTPTYDPQKETVTYSAKLPPEISSDELVLVFKRVGGDSTAPAAYVCTTEVSFGQFSDAVTAAGRWPQMSQLLWRYDPGEGDPRFGPRIWEWPRYGSMSRGVKRTIYWLAGNAEHYPAELSTLENRMVLKDATGRASRELNPGKRHPMQYVSPAAAMGLAEMLGCRLITPAEWKAAAQKQASAKRSNLRDRTWGSQFRWAYASRGSERYAPDLGIFMPAGERRSSELWSDGAQTAARGNAATSAYNDGVLWFEPVSGEDATEFAHLVGNVAELCAADGKVFVIGGSALSPPAPVRAVDAEQEVPEWRTARGWSDVGFRVAFSAPTAPLEKLRLAVREQGFVVAPGR